MEHSTFVTTTAQPSGASIQLIVVPPQGVSAFTLMTALDTTVASVAAQIEARTSIPVGRQVLTRNGLSVPAESKFRDLGLQDGATLHVHPALIGGCGCGCCTIL